MIFSKRKELAEEVDALIEKDCACDCTLNHVTMLQRLGMLRERPEDRPKIVVICGSSRFVDIMAVCAWLIEKQEQAIVMSLHLLPQWYCKDLVDDHLAEKEGVSEQMDELHLRKIYLGDEIFVVDFKDYIGNSTEREIEYAQNNDKNIRRYSRDPIGDQVNAFIRERR